MNMSNREHVNDQTHIFEEIFDFLCANRVEAAVKGTYASLRFASLRLSLIHSFMYHVYID